MLARRLLLVAAAAVSFDLTVSVLGAAAGWARWPTLPKPAVVVAETEVGAEPQEATLQLTGVICSGWVPRIQRALEGLPGVQKVTIELTGGEVKVWYGAPATSPDRLADALTSMGFPARVQKGK